MGAPTRLDRLDAALASGAAKLWSELLGALALTGQCAAGVRCFSPDPPGADGRASRRPGAAAAERLPDDVQ